MPEPNENVPATVSSLIFHTEQEQAIIATDTLAVSPGGRPLTFTSKGFHVPHLRMVIAGTGCGGFTEPLGGSSGRRSAQRMS